MKIVKLPLNFAECGQEEKEHLFHQIFDDVFLFLQENRYTISGDVIGIKISMSLEEENEEQYVLVGVPFSEEEKN